MLPVEVVPAMGSSSDCISHRFSQDHHQCRNIRCEFSLGLHWGRRVQSVANQLRQITACYDQLLQWRPVSRLRESRLRLQLGCVFILQDVLLSTLFCGRDCNQAGWNGNRSKSSDFHRRTLECGSNSLMMCVNINAWVCRAPLLTDFCSTGDPS